MRQYIIAGNWKMNKTVSESVQLAKDIVEAAKDVKKTEVVIAPTYLAAAKVADVVKGTNVKLAIQDIHWKDQGAYTGKVSVDMVKEIGAEYIIIGHSEQRQYFHETEETVNLKVKKTLEAGLKPIICIGETLDQRNGGILKEVLGLQVKGAFKDVSAEDAALRRSRCRRHAHPVRWLHEGRQRCRPPRPEGHRRRSHWRCRSQGQHLQGNHRRSRS